MAGATLYTNGIGGTSGADVASLSPLYTSGAIWYCSSVTGSDSYAGKDRQKPFATLSAAYTAASAGDAIVFLSGHSETLTSGQTIAKADLWLVGEGTGTSRPTFTRGANIVMWDMTAANIRVENILFAAGTVASSSSKVRTTSTQPWFGDCYFSAGANDTGAQLECQTGTRLVIKDTYFVSVATVVTAQPESALKISTATANGTVLDNVVFDGGTTGWSNPFALNGASTTTGMRWTNIDLLGDSDITIATVSTGIVHIRSTTGSGRVIWTP